MNSNLILNFKKQNPDTKIFGLIGSPIEHSVGDIFHNNYFKKLKINAAYFKWEVNLNSLAVSISFLKKHVYGLSVTMPLKEQIFKYSDNIEANAKIIGAINTMTLKNNVWVGSNTDGLGAIQALGVPITKKVIAILGSGGAARAIIYTAIEQGAKVLIFNRDINKATHLAQLFGAEGAYTLNKVTEIECDILINTLPFGVQLEIERLKKCKIIMDITNGENNSWLAPIAKKNNLQFIDKTPMFEAQALLQLKGWGIIPQI